MSERSIRKFLQIQLRSFIYRRYLDIITLISLFALCFILLKIHFYPPFNSLQVTNINFESTTNKYQMARKQPIGEAHPEKSHLKTTETPLKTKLKTILNCNDMPLRQEKLQYGEYWVIKNYIRGRKSLNMGCGESITYTTHGDYTFMENLATVVERWLGPVSFALYAPGDDYNTTMDSIQYVRNCLPQSKLIRDYVTFHIFFPNLHLPASIAKNEEEISDWPYKCELKSAPYVNVNRLEMYKTLKNLTYPINVARNIARKTANTYFVFACDIELYPSLGLVDKFLEMVVKNPTSVVKDDKRKVFVLPVFELHKNATLPQNKTELQKMLNTSLAIPFHKFVCSNCHLVPKQKQWVKANNSRELEVFTVGKRYKEFKSWEPFYISDNKEPLFDERFTWETQANKRIQNYAMCLLDYEYHILHPGFLVHAPGIKVLNLKLKGTKTRLNYAEAMRRKFDKEIRAQYAALYDENKNCTL